MNTLIEIYVCGCFICAMFGFWKMYEKRVQSNGTYVPSKQEMSDLFKLSIKSWYGFYLFINDKENTNKD